MRSIVSRIVCLFCLVVILAAAGCVAPPEELSPAGGAKTTAPTSATTSPTPTAVYVTLVTPSAAPTSTIETQGYSQFTTQTMSPEERSCRIFTHSQTFSYDGTAFTFDLKNPPMYITYKVTPSEITVKKVRTHSINKTEFVSEYETFDPHSFLEITVKDKKTGEIYLQDGFGTGYSQYTTRTLKVLNSDDLFIEIKGNLIKGTVDVWVKPVGNFENPDSMNFDTCTFWSQTTRDYLPIALVTSSPTPTWTLKK